MKNSNKDFEHETKFRLVQLENECKMLNRLVTILFLELIAIMGLLIIWSW